MFALPLLLSFAHAGEITRPIEAGDRRVLAGYAAEPHSVASLGYAHGLSLGQRDLGLTASLAAPVFLLDGRHHRVELAARAPVVARGPGQLDARLGLMEQSTRSALVQGTALSTSLTAIGGRVGERGFLALELGASWSPAARLAPTVYYEDTLDVDMPTGWYANPAAYGSLGLQGGWAFRERLELAGRVALDKSLGGGARTAPVTMGLALNVWL